MCKKQQRGQRNIACILFVTEEKPNDDKSKAGVSLHCFSTIFQLNRLSISKTGGKFFFFRILLTFCKYWDLKVFVALGYKKNSLLPFLKRHYDLLHSMYIVLFMCKYVCHFKHFLLTLNPVSGF